MVLRRMTRRMLNKDFPGSQDRTKELSAFLGNDTRPLVTCRAEDRVSRYETNLVPYDLAGE
jgi:hypothetical protein